MGLALGLNLTGIPLSAFGGGPNGADSQISAELANIPAAYHSGIRAAADATAVTESTTSNAVITLLAGLDYWWSANPDSTGASVGNQTTSWNDWINNTGMAVSAGSRPTIENDATHGDYLDFDDNSFLLSAANTNGDAAVGDVIIFAIYSSDGNTSGDRVFGFGSNEINTSSDSLHFNPACDPSLRFDGSAISGGYSQTHPTVFFLRSAQRVGDNFTDYFNKTPVKTGTNSTGAIVDEFYVGTNIHNVPSAGFSAKLSTAAIAFGTRTAAELAVIQEFFIQYRNI